MAARRLAFGLLALALLLAQALALVHRAGHATDLPLPASLAAPVDEHAHEDHPGWVSRLFPHEAGDLDCRLLDALGHDGLKPPQSAAFAAALPPVLLAWAQGECLARWAALFEARGPPLSR